MDTRKPFKEEMLADFNYLSLIKKRVMLTLANGSQIDCVAEHVLKDWIRVNDGKKAFHVNARTILTIEVLAPEVGTK